MDGFSTNLDRQTTGIAIADIDLSTIDAVRTRMPISEVSQPEISQWFVFEELLFWIARTLLRCPNKLWYLSFSIRG